MGLPGVKKSTLMNRCTEERWDFYFELDKSDGSWETFSALGYLDRFLGGDEGGFNLHPLVGCDGLAVEIEAMRSEWDPSEFAEYLKRYFCAHFHNNVNRGG